MCAPRHSLSLAAAALLAATGCGGLGLWSAPAEHLDTGGESGSSGSTSASTTSSGGTTDGTSATTGGSTGVGTTNGTSTGTTSASSSSSTTTTGSTGNCSGQTPPAIHCARADGASSWFMMGESPQLSCTVDPGMSPTSWTGLASVSTFSVDARNAPGNIYVGLNASGLPIGFGDTQVDVAITAVFCNGGAQSTDHVQLPVVGNNLAADNWNGQVLAFASGGQSLGVFGGAVVAGHPSVVAALDDGSVLVGGSTQLVKLDRSGAKLADFDLVNHTGQPLFGSCGQDCSVEPWGAANASDGSVWVAANSGRGSTGHVYRFTANGLYLDEVPAVLPPSGSGEWLPMGVARRPSDNAMIVTSGYEHDPAYVVIFPDGSTTGTYGSVGMQACTGQPDGGNPSCGPNSAAEAGLSGAWIDADGTLYVTNIWEFDNDGDIGAFDASTLTFRRASYHPTSGSDPMYNQWLRGIVRAGDWLLLDVWNGDCIWAIDPQTLMPLPQGRGVSANGCIAYSFGADFDAVAHLGSHP